MQVAARRFGHFRHQILLSSDLRLGVCSLVDPSGGDFTKRFDGLGSCFSCRRHKLLPESCRTICFQEMVLRLWQHLLSQGRLSQVVLSGSIKAFVYPLLRLQI